jgi:predicted transcriptional regulator
MEEAKILDEQEPVSKALDDILTRGTAVFITRGKEYIGLIDDRNMRTGMQDPSKVHCGAVCVKSPSVSDDADIEGMLDAFISGNFKSLPAISKSGKITGMVSRVGVLKALLDAGAMPHAPVGQHMVKPVFTIDQNATLDEAKALMHEKGVHRLVVTHNGGVAGTISTFDFTAMLTKPKGKRGYYFENIHHNAGEHKVYHAMRGGEVCAVLESGTVADAANEMVKKRKSSAIVMQKDKAVGILAASDIFKLVKGMLTETVPVEISGLSEEDLIYYDRIKAAIVEALKKFSRSFSVGGVVVHVKKNKSVYEFSLHFTRNGQPMFFKCEEHSIGEALSLLSKELKTQFEKAKMDKMENIKRAEVEHGGDE